MELFILAVLGGLLALDGTAMGQFMVSRPLVAGVLAGCLTGTPELGAAIGALLELYLLVSFPTGGSRFPEGSTATVVAVAIAAPIGGAGATAVAIGVGLLWGQLGGFSIVLQRRLNSHLLPPATDLGPGGVRLVRAHLGAIGLDFVRGALLTVLGVVVGRAVLGATLRAWTVSPALSDGVLFAGAATSLGILLHDLGGFRKRRVLFAAGLALGVVGARFL